MGVLDKKIQQFRALYLFQPRTTGGLTTTLAAAALKDATTLSLTSGTGSANGDDLLLGSGETLERVRIASGGNTTSITLAQPLKFDHANTEEVVSAEAFDFGPPEADGFNLTYGGETVDVFTAISRFAYQVIIGYVDLGASWRWPVVTVDTIAYALGVPRAQVIGNGTLAAQTGTVGPRCLTTDSTNLATARKLTLAAAVVLNDGSHVLLELYNLSIDPTAFTTTFARGQLTTFPVRVAASSGAINYTNALFTPSLLNTGSSASKGDVFASIAGLSKTADGTATTTTAPIAAGAFVIPATSVTGIAAGTVLRLGTGDLAEYHIVHNVASLNVNLRTQVLRAHVSGVAVVPQVLTKQDIAQGGVTLACTGSVEPVRDELNRVTLGLKVSNAALVLSYNIDTIKPESARLALSIPSSTYDVGGSKVLPLGNDIGQAGAETFLVQLLTMNGKQVNLLAWSAALAPNGETKFASNANALFPVSGKPNGMNIIAHP